jgi:hypothetical protein
MTPATATTATLGATISGDSKEASKKRRQAAAKHRSYRAAERRAMRRAASSANFVSRHRRFPRSRQFVPPGSGPAMQLAASAARSSRQKSRPSQAPAIKEKSVAQSR